MDAGGSRPTAQSNRQRSAFRADFMLLEWQVQQLCLTSHGCLV